jgi:hypothetical protein
MTVQRTEERIELTAVDRASGVVNQVRGSFDGLRTSVDATKNVLLGVASALGVNEMLAYARSVISATAALSNLSSVTGASVEGLSQVREIAKIGGHDFQGFTEAIGTMIRSLKVSGDEGKAASHALEFLGVKARDSNGIMRDTVDILFDVAKALTKYTDDGDKAAIVQDILGKGAAKYIPQLKDMAEQGRSVAKETAKQAEEADKLDKNINRLTASLSEAKREMITGLVPAINEVVESLIKANKEGGKFGFVVQAWREAAGYGALGLVGFGAARGLSFLEGMNPNRGGPNLWQFAGINPGGPGFRGAYADMGFEPALPTPSGYRSPGKKEAGGEDPYKSLLQGLENELAKTQGLTRAEEVLFQLQQARYAHVGVAERKRAVDLAKAIDALKQEEETRKRMLEVMTKEAGENDARIEQKNEWLRTTTEAIRQAEFEVELVGRSADEVERLTKIRELENGARKAGIDLAGSEFQVRREALEQAILQKNALAAIVKTQEEARKAAEEEFKSRSEMISRGITDALMRGFEGGKSVARNFFDGLKNMAKTVVLEPVIRFIVAPFSGAMASMLPSMANAAGGGGFGMPGGFNPFSGIQNLFGGGVGSGISGAMGIPELGLIADAGTAAASAGAMGGMGLGMGALGIGALGLGALALLGGDLFGEGGGPKGSTAWLQGGRGHFNIGVSDVAGGENMAAINAFNALLNDPTKFDPDTLAKHVGTSVGSGSPADTGTLLGQITQALSAAADEAKRLAQETERLAQAERQAAAEKRTLEIRLMTAQGDELGALAATRQLEIEATAESNRAILAQIHAAEDLAAAAQEAAEAIEREAQAIREAHELRMAIEAEGADIRGRLLEITNPGKAAIAAREREIAGAFEENRPLLRELFAAMDAAAEAANAQEEAAKASDAAARALEQAADQLQSMEASLADGVRGLPGRLGIDSLRSYRDAANMSEYLSPMARLSGARGVYQDLLSRAQGGDLDAVSGLPRAAQSLLGIGRDVYASGGQFQSLFVDVNRGLAGVLERQERVQADLLRGVSAAILQASANTNETLSTEFEGLKEEVVLLRAEVRKLKTGTG